MFEFLSQFVWSAFVFESGVSERFGVTLKCMVILKFQNAIYCQTVL